MAIFFAAAGWAENYAAQTSDGAEHWYLSVSALVLLAIAIAIAMLVFLTWPKRQL
jgi:hypothetical protein